MEKRQAALSHLQAQYTPLLRYLHQRDRIHLSYTVKDSKTKYVHCQRLHNNGAMTFVPEALENLDDPNALENLDDPDGTSGDDDA
jgi:hypothetical protein